MSGLNSEAEEEEESHPGNNHNHNHNNNSNHNNNPNTAGLTHPQRLQEWGPRFQRLADLYGEAGALDADARAMRTLRGVGANPIQVNGHERCNGHA